MKYRKILLWGLGERMLYLWRYIEEELVKGNIQIVAGVDKDHIRIPMPFITISPAQIADVEFDYLVITAETPFWNIYDDALRLGIKTSQIICGNIFMNPDFDFLKYENMNRLTERIFGNIFYDETYADRNRDYHNLDISISMGRKSYIGKTRIELGFFPAVINIGNFSAISWDITFDLGQNMDHDYRRVMNYGITHLNLDVNKAMCGGVHQCDNTSIIDIGSDVWIGKGVTIRGGVKIGNGAVVAARSYVIKDVPNYAIVGGNPARFIKYRFPPETMLALDKVQWWNWSIEKVQENISYFYNIEKFINFFCKEKQ